MGRRCRVPHRIRNWIAAQTADRRIPIPADKGSRRPTERNRGRMLSSVGPRAGYQIMTTTVTLPLRGGELCLRCSKDVFNTLGERVYMCGGKPRTGYNPLTRWVRM